MSDFEKIPGVAEIRRFEDAAQSQYALLRAKIEADRMKAAQEARAALLKAEEGGWIERNPGKTVAISLVLLALIGCALVWL